MEKPKLALIGTSRKGTKDWTTIEVDLSVNGAVDYLAKRTSTTVEQVCNDVAINRGLRGGK